MIWRAWKWSERKQIQESNRRIVYSRELEERFVRFSIAVIDWIKGLPHDRVVVHLVGQYIRSANSPALNHGEALGAASRKEFVHKPGAGVKELRETLNCLRILAGTGYIKLDHPVTGLCNELISRVVEPIKTTKSVQGK